MKLQKLPRLSGKEIVKALSKIGFQAARQKGSHLILIRYINGKKKATVVPMHKEVDKGTLLEIIRQATITKEEFLSLLR